MKLYDGWTTNGNWSTTDATSYTNTQISERDLGRSGAAETIGGGVASSSTTGWGPFKKSTTNNFSVVGIKVSEIPNMREAIRIYVQGIKDHLDGIEPLATANSAFKSEEVQGAVKTYIAKVKEYCMNLVSQLLAFSDKLDEVRQKYEENMATLAGNVGESTSSLNAGNTYTEQK